MFQFPGLLPLKGTPYGVGCPIQKSTDQSLFAAPHGLSQRITSFIASCRQGIHRMPLRHLITLIINVHLFQGARAPLKRSFICALTCFALLERVKHSTNTKTSGTNTFASNQIQHGPLCKNPSHQRLKHKQILIIKTSFTRFFRQSCGQA